jgi:hypothetical protein
MIMVALLAGDFHFLSDIIAGAFVGLSLSALALPYRCLMPQRPSTVCDGNIEHAQAASKLLTDFLSLDDIALTRSPAATTPSGFG